MKSLENKQFSWQYWDNIWEGVGVKYNQKYDHVVYEWPIKREIIVRQSFRNNFQKVPYDEWLSKIFVTIHAWSWGDVCVAPYGYHRKKSVRIQSCHSYHDGIFSAPRVATQAQCYRMVNLRHLGININLWIFFEFCKQNWKLCHFCLIFKQNLAKISIF